VENLNFYICSFEIVIFISYKFAYAITNTHINNMIDKICFWNKKNSFKNLNLDVILFGFCQFGKYKLSNK